MNHERLIADVHLMPLVRCLSPQELARVACLLNELAFAITNDESAALHVLNCVGNQIHKQLGLVDGDRFCGFVTELHACDRVTANKR